MSSNVQFCPKCGAPLPQGARSCASCGEIVASATAPSQLADTPASSGSVGLGERVLSLIPNVTLKAGFMGFGSKQYTLILTDRRVVFAQITVAMMKQLVADARDGAKSEGKGFFGQWGAQLGAYSQFAQRYLEMSPDQALAESENNFAIDRSTITKTSMKVSHNMGDDVSTTDRLIIKTTSKKYDITLVYGLGQAKEALQTANML